MTRIIIFIVFINVFMLLIFIKIINKIKNFKKSFTINSKCCVTIIKWFKLFVILRLMFIALKTCFYLIFSDIKMYSLLNLIINEKLKFIWYF